MIHRFLTQFIFLFSLITNFLSLNLKPIFTKTLDFIKMDSFFFSADDDDMLYGTSISRSINSLSDLDDEKLYLVNHRWWNEPRMLMFKEVGGVSYAASSCLSADFDSEIVLELNDNNVVEEDGVSPVSGCEYALVSEWMFYRALKWLESLYY